MIRLPTYRLGSFHEEDQTFHNIGIDSQPSSGSKFRFAWPRGSSLDAQSRSDLSPRLEHNYPASYVTSTPELTEIPPVNHFVLRAPATPGLASTAHHPNIHAAPSSLPRLSRAVSMPLPSQAGQFWHQIRSSSRAGTYSPTTPASDGSPSTAETHLNELSLELADSVQTAIQTLLYLSPAQLFGPAKEQLSASTVQIPVSSISGLLTSMKHLNYLSMNMTTLGSPHQDGLTCPASTIKPPVESMGDDFDIGELLQSVGDSLGGVAAEAGVELVLHHGDAIQQMAVKGDECGISYAIFHVIHQVLNTTRPGDTIDIGLSMITHPSSLEGDTVELPSASPAPSRQGSMSSSTVETTVLDAGGHVMCTLDISHQFLSLSFGIPAPNGSTGDPQAEDVEKDLQASRPETRPKPQFDTTILRRLLLNIRATLQPSLQPKLFPQGRRCKLIMILERGHSHSTMRQKSSLTEAEISGNPFPDAHLTREPSMEELMKFTAMLRRKRVVLHASSQGLFSHHLKRYMAAWSMDISHVPASKDEETETAEDIPVIDSGYRSFDGTRGLETKLPGSEIVPPIFDNGSDEPGARKMNLSFIIIDDDVHVLRRQLLRHRGEALTNFQTNNYKRPSLAVNQRPRSSSLAQNSKQKQSQGDTSTFFPVPIVYFTSLANYRLVKDTVHTILVAPDSPPLLPEVIVIPKPVGPRRLVTALYTAQLKPVVEPCFLPIATLPMSTGGSLSQLLTGRNATSNATGPSASRGGSVRASRSPSDLVTRLPSSSPLWTPEGVEYFSEATVERLGDNAASGVVIQSPDGRPRGIFFQPQSSKSSSSRINVSGTAMERERGPPMPGGRLSTRLSSEWKTNSSTQDGPSDTFHEAVQRIGPSPANSPPITCDKPSTVLPRFELPDNLEELPIPGLVGADSMKKLSTSPPAAWGDIIQHLTKLPSTSLGSNLDIAVTASMSRSHINNPPVPVPTHSTDQLRAPLTMPGYSSSPILPGARRSTARPAMPSLKIPVAPKGMKKSKTKGNNIVPPINVLIVEDNAINQTILSMFMRRNNIKYDVAWNGREAIEKWQSGNFHLILMDIHMPVMDGIEATREIRRLEKVENMSHFPLSPTGSYESYAESPESRASSDALTPISSQVIIVALTASSLRSDRVAALAAGCNDFLTKPVRNSWLTDKIIEWGSIKTLQMWAKLRPELAKNMHNDQIAQTQAIANKLHVPAASARRAPSNNPKSPLLALTDSQLVRNIEVLVTEVNATQPSDYGLSFPAPGPGRFSL